MCSTQASSDPYCQPAFSVPHRHQKNPLPARTSMGSGIFPISSLDMYDFTRPKSIDRDVVERAATLDFIRERSNVVFVGPSGVGKTHLANAIAYLACVEGYRVRFSLAADLVNDLVASQTRNTLSKRLASWACYDLLLIDELGYLSFDSRGADLLYQVINKRYLRASTIVTTNLLCGAPHNLFYAESDVMRSEWRLASPIGPWRCAGTAHNGAGAQLSDQFVRRLEASGPQLRLGHGF
jgi:DNA replication protein DnaC